MHKSDKHMTNSDIQNLSINIYTAGIPYSQYAHVAHTILTSAFCEKAAA